MVLNDSDRPASAATMVRRLTPAASASSCWVRNWAVLKAAAEFVGLWGQTREEVKSDHVLVLADKWLKWVEGN